MITKNALKFFEFQNIEEYFDYILESKINGQHKQSKEYFNRLSEEQKNDFFNYIGTLYHYELENENREELTELQNYFNN